MSYWKIYLSLQHQIKTYKNMKLLEALKHCSIENLDTTELIYDGDEWAVDYFFVNIKALFSPEDYKLMETTELDDAMIEEIRTNAEEIIEDNILYNIIAAGLMANDQVNYAELDEEDLDSLYWDEANYEVNINNVVFEYCGDIDLT